jgi:hypothetical protein
VLSTTARRGAGALLFAALSFVALTSLAVWLYPGYRFTHQFLSELGVTQTWWRRPNHEAAIAFSVGVASLGLGMIVFAAAWRDYAFAKGRARGVGLASQACGSLSGLSFVGVACSPMNLALDLHNALVVAAFVLLLAFAICLTSVWWKNGAPRSVLVGGALFAVLIAGYVAAFGWAVATEPRAHRQLLVIAQKVVVSAALAYVVLLTLTVRRTSSAP